MDITVHKHYIQKTLRYGCIVTDIYYTKRPPANPPCQFESGQPLNIPHNYYRPGTNFCISNQNSQKFHAQIDTGLVVGGVRFKSSYIFKIWTAN